MNKTTAEMIFHLTKIILKKINSICCP